MWGLLLFFNLKVAKNRQAPLQFMSTVLLVPWLEKFNILHLQWPIAILHLAPGRTAPPLDSRSLLQGLLLPLLPLLQLLLVEEEAPRFLLKGPGTSMKSLLPLRCSGNYLLLKSTCRHYTIHSSFGWTSYVWYLRTIIVLSYLIILQGREVLEFQAQSWFTKNSSFSSALSTT